MKAKWVVFKVPHEHGAVRITEVSEPLNENPEHEWVVQGGTEMCLYVHPTKPVVLKFEAVQ